MRNLASLGVALFTLAILIFPASVLATLTVECSIDQNIFVAINFKGMDPTTYAEIKTNTQRFNATTIPLIIMKNLAARTLKRVGWGYARIYYDDAENSVRVTFYLGGSDIISFTVNKTSTVRTYRVSTDWRRFKVDLTEGFSVDFGQRFGTPLSQWQPTNRTDALGVHPSYYYEQLDEDALDVSFYFILPTTAENIHAEEDTLTYDVPPYAEDAFLNSPLLILGAIMAVTAIVVVYRKSRA